MNKSVVVTGAGGFVGANVVRRLISEGWAVHAIVRSGSNLWRLADVAGKIIIHEGLLGEPQKLRQTLVKIKPEAIYHLATYGSYPKQQDTARMVAVNITGLLNLLEASREIPYVRFAVSGSSSEYGKKVKPMGENDIPEPNNMYAACKLAATNLALMHARAYAKPVTVLRLFNVYGFYEEPGRLVRNVITAVQNGQPILLSTGREARDFIFAEDVADAFIHITRRDKKFDAEIFNIGTGRQTTVKQLAQRVIKLTGQRVRIKLHAYEGRVWDSFHWQADMTKTGRVLKWKAKTDLTTGLQKTIRWYKQHT
jgi:nucleoside-diphosphate-sugar epimerase